MKGERASGCHKARFRMDEFYSQFHLPTGIADDSPKRYIHRAPVLNADSLPPATRCLFFGARNRMMLLCLTSVYLPHPFPTLDPSMSHPSPTGIHMLRGGSSATYSEVRKNERGKRT